MNESAEHRLCQFRAYLKVLAEMQLPPMIRSRVDPSDIVQQTLLNAHRAIKDFRGQSDAELAGWLRQILARELVHQLRDQQRQKRDVSRETSMQVAIDASSTRLEAFLASDDPRPESLAARNERICRLADALKRLPELQREAIELNYWHRWSLQKIADHQKRSKSAVIHAIRRGLSSLKKELDEGSNWR